MSYMKKLDIKGAVDVWLLAFSAVLILFFGAAGFGIWAYTGMQDYKNNVEPKIATAVAKAEEETSSKKDKEFTEKEKQPLRNYTGPTEYGSLSINYPKTWSVYADESGSGSAPVSAHLNPNFVPGLQSNNNVALRLEVVNTAYSQVVSTIESSVKSGKVTAKPYSLSTLPSVVGLRLDGEVVNQKQGAMIVLPLRDKTIKVWTEASQFVADFDNIILPNTTFVP